MHRSRTCAVIIDVPRAQAGAAATFWSGVFGTPERRTPEEPQFTSLPGAIPRLETAVQAIDGEARYHLDVETDDLDAEVARLVALGAERVSRWMDCVVLRAPGGHLLCVLPVHSDPEVFDAEAHSWP